jgi:hypothetical protein
LATRGLPENAANDLDGRAVARSLSRLRLNGCIVGVTLMSWLLTDPSALKGTVYFEFLPGRYAGECWQRGSIFLTEQAFAHIEPIFAKHRPDYDHYAFVEIPRSQWEPILQDLEAMAEFLHSRPAASEVCERVGFFAARNKEAFVQELESNVAQLRTTLVDLLRWIRDRLASNDAISVLGI